MPGYNLFLFHIPGGVRGHFLFDDLEALCPPRNPHPPLPTMKPKVYQIPLLLAANTETSSHHSMATRSMGAMIPCHSPPQKP